MEHIRDVMRKKDTFVIALIMLYESKSKNPLKVYRVLICAIYSLIKNYFCIEYLCCQ